MNPLLGKPRQCPFCHQQLERQREQWVCFHCLLIWHGDTFEPLDSDPKRKPSRDAFYP